MERLRVLVPGAACVALVCLCAFALDWFRVEIEGYMVAGMDLRSVKGCANDVCKLLSFSKLSGSFPMVATLTFFESLGFALLVGVQTYTKLVKGEGSDRLARLNYAIASLLILMTIATCAIPPKSHEIYSLHVTLRWAPLLMVLAAIAGIVANFNAAHRDDLPPKSTLPEARVT